MKIYPSRHDIRDSRYSITDPLGVSPRDIPLSFIDTEDIQREIATNSFLQERSEENLEPFERFDSREQCLFGPDGSRINDLASILREPDDGAGYYYLPDITSEDAKTFSVSALIKKQAVFRNDRVYNIALSCVDATEEESTSRALIAILGNAPETDHCPWNLWVNDKSTERTSLLDGNIKDSDFAIFDAGEEITLQDYADRLDEELFSLARQNNTNLWLCLPEDAECVEPADGVFYLKDPVLFEQSEYSLSHPYKINLDKVKEAFPEEDYTYLELFEEESPLAILEKDRENFIIIGTQSFFTGQDGRAIVYNQRFFYEVIAQLFIQSYYRSEPQSSWIMGHPVDKVAGQRGRYGLNHGRVSLSGLLQNKRFLLEEDEYELIEIDTDDEEVVCTWIDDFGQLYFEGPGDLPGHGGEEDEVSMHSVYNGKDQVIYYKEDEAKKIETPLEIRVEEAAGRVLVKVFPFKSTRHRVELTKPVEFELKNPDGGYFIARKSIDQIELTTDQDSYILASVHIQQERDTTCHDLRVPGGGLLETEEDDFNLLDIGHIHGRPYRAGATLIVRLPARLEPYKEIIKKELDRYKTAGEYVALLFER